MSPRTLKSSPALFLQGEIFVPGDKSISHRAIMLGSIAQGVTSIKGCSEGADCLSTIAVFKQMGVRIEHPFTGHIIIRGVGKFGLQAPKFMLHCGNSGTTVRLLAGILAAQNFDSELTGDQSLLQRPMARICRPLRQMGAEIITHEEQLPMVIRGGKNLQGMTYEIPEASAQVKSCLLFAGLYAQGETCITESALTRDHTERLLTAFAYPLTRKGKMLVINAESECKATDLMIPGDISSAAFFIVAATLIPQSKLVIKNVGINPTRTGIITLLQRMGANIKISNEHMLGEELVADLIINHARLTGITIPAAMVPLTIDEFPILFIAAACAKGKTRLSGAKELRYKESDRIAVMVEGLQRLGIAIEAEEEGVLIEGGILQGGVVNSHHDHRIAMAFAVAGAVAKSTVTVLNCENIGTSYPHFITTANAINMVIDYDS